MFGSGKNMDIMNYNGHKDDKKSILNKSMFSAMFVLFDHQESGATKFSWEQSKSLLQISEPASPFSKFETKLVLQYFGRHKPKIWKLIQETRIFVRNCINCFYWSARYVGIKQADSVEIVKILDTYSNM